MKCANCSRDALYEYKMTPTLSIFYCDKDLPRFLHSRRDAGTLGITDVLTDNLESALEALAPEQPDTQDDETTPKKKVVKKKAE